MKVIQVVPSVNEEASGPSYSVPALCRSLRARGVEVALHVLAPASAAALDGGELHAYPVWPFLSKLYISPSMRAGLRQAAARSEIMHNHSLWLMPNLYPAWAVAGTPCRLVTSPRGTLSPWALRRSRWAKRIMWRVWQGDAVKASACLHATTPAEFQDIRGAGLRAPVAIIPNGVDLPALSPIAPDPKRLRRLLFLGRIHPIKGIPYLLRAWRRVQEQAPDWELCIVGPDNEGYLNKMRELARDLNAERVSFPGPLYGDQKSAAFQEADLFVLPSHSENFGMAVAESLAHGLPAIVSRHAPWPGLIEHDCGWWIELSEGALTECLGSALSLSGEELRARGARGRAWMEREFSWSRIGRMMHDTYQWLLGGGSPPGWVMTDSR